MAPTTAKTTKSTSKGKAVTLDTTNKDIEAIFSNTSLSDAEKQTRVLALIAMKDSAQGAMVRLQQGSTVEVLLDQQQQPHNS